MNEFSDEFANYISENHESSPEGVARIAAWTGQNDLAFEYLERSVDRYGAGIAYRVMTDLYEPIKSDPRWTEFLERNGVVDEGLSHIEFNPPMPPEVTDSLKRMRERQARTEDL